MSKYLKILQKTSQSALTYFQCLYLPTHPSQVLHALGGLIFLKRVIFLLGAPLLVAHFLVCSLNVQPYFSP